MSQNQRLGLPLLASDSLYISRTDNANQCKEPYNHHSNQWNLTQFLISPPYKMQIRNIRNLLCKRVASVALCALSKPFLSSIRLLELLGGSFYTSLEWRNGWMLQKISICNAYHAYHIHHYTIIWECKVIKVGINWVI